MLDRSALGDELLDIAVDEVSVYWLDGAGEHPKNPEDAGAAHNDRIRPWPRVLASRGRRHERVLARHRRNGEASAQVKPDSCFAIDRGVPRLGAGGTSQVYPPKIVLARSLGLVLPLLVGCAAAGPTSISIGPRSVSPAGVVHEEFTFGGKGGMPLYGQHWSPAAGQERAALIVLHGLKDHSARYQALAEEGVARGYAVWAYDQRGHGRSSGDRVSIDSFDDYLDDLDIFIARVRAAEPNKQVFLFAHSMGGCVATLYTLKHKPMLGGLLLSGPAIEPARDTASFLIAITRVIGFIAPGALVFDTPNEKQTRDPQSLDTENKDPLVSQGNAPAHTAIELLNAMSEIRDHWDELDVPLLDMHGTADLLTNPKGSEDLVTHAKSNDKTLKLYPGLYHDLLREPERAQVRKDVLDWMDWHVSPATASAAPGKRASEAAPTE